MPLAPTIRAVGRRPGMVSSLALAASGIGIAARPRQAAAALGLSAASARGATEARAGLGGTYAGLGLWALARRRSDAYTAVGVTWLGAAALRVLSLWLDQPETDWSFWAYLAGEVTFGVAGLAARR